MSQIIVTAQKKVILGESVLYPTDAIVQVSVGNTGQLEIESMADYWTFDVVFWLTVSHANFPKGSRSFNALIARVCTNQPRGNCFWGGGGARVNAPDPLWVSRDVAAARRAAQAVFPRLQDFIIAEYMVGEVSLTRIRAFFNEYYKAPVVAKKRSKKA